MADIIATTKPRARKQHTCSYCGGTIEIGETYQKDFCKNGGDAYSWKGHFECQEIAEELDMFNLCDDGELTSGAFQEFVAEEFSDEFSTHEKVKMLLTSYKE